MSYKPCKNSSCKSFGRPHPNCRCYGGHAEGGKVESYCVSDRPHQNGCQYFQEGGEVLPDDEVVIDEGPIETDIMPSDPVTEEIPDTDVIIDEEPISDDDVVIDDNEPSELASTGLALVEGASRGLLGPLGPLAMAHNPMIPDGEAKRMMSLEEQGKRSREHPIAGTVGEIGGLIGGLATGAGMPGVIAKGAMAATQAANMGKAGALIVQGLLTNGAFQTSDEVSKWLLGEGNPEEPVAAAAANIGFAGLIGAMTGAAGSAAVKAKNALASSKISVKMRSFLEGLSTAAESPTDETRDVVEMVMKSTKDVDFKSFKNGMRAYDDFIDRYSTPAAGGMLGAMEAAGDGDNMAIGFLKGMGIAVGGKIAVTKISQSIAPPTLVRIMGSGSTHDAMEVLEHARNVSKGSKAIDTAIEKMFTASGIIGQQILNQRDKVSRFIDEGGVQQGIQEQIYDDNVIPDPDPVQNFAQGGEVKAEKPQKLEGMSDKRKIKPVLDSNGAALGTYYPEQNIVMSTMRLRISDYLGGLKPAQFTPKLAFDHEPDNREKKKSYDKALDIAVQPLSILNQVARGSVDTESLKHFNAMYPELNGLLQKRITDKITQQQVDGKKPPYKVRQALSVFMGTPLSSEFTPFSINAAQSVFKMQPGAQQAPAAPPVRPTKSSMSTLTKSDDAFLTSNQARQARMQRPS